LTIPFADARDVRKTLMASSPRIEELRKKFEENPRRYFAPLANEYRKAGDVEQAIAICREYLPQQPGHMSGHIVFGQALYEARNFEEAKAVFETALSLDPENLIALRHLGDISLITGDTEGARTWYTKVLEADPRNEEIQAQLATIDRAAASAPTPPITPAVPPTPEAPAVGTTAAPMQPTAPSGSAPTVVMKAVPRPGAAAPAPAVTATSPTAEIRLDEIIPAQPQAQPASRAEPTVEIPVTSVTESAMGSQAAGPDTASTMAPIEGLEGTAAAGAGDSPMDSFSLDGLETTSLSSPPNPPVAPPPPTAAPEVSDAMPLADVDFGPPAAAPAPEAAPVIADLEPQAATPEPLDLDFAAPQSLPSGGAEPPPLDLDLASLTPVAREPQTSSPPAVGTAAEVAMAAPAPEALAAAPPSPFVTETMAELYLQQGHREEAVQVYRALVQQRPGDAGLQAKLDSLLPEQVSRTQAESQVAQGPTIRELLAAIAARRPGYRPEWPGGNGMPASAEHVPQAASQYAPAQPAAEAPAAAVDRPAAEFPAGDDALGQVLGFASPTDANDAAARVLARAFMGNGTGREPSPAMAGTPARPASGDLTLDTVFKDAEPPPPPSSFSFDQFFSQRANADHVTGGAEAQAAESAEEVAQFTQWLEGLKRR
jgi:tetratricopeptide (TPR) repeat protein